MAPITLNTNPMVSPTIRNGRRISQISGNRNSAANARGQQITNNRHQRIIVRNVRIANCFDQALQTTGQFLKHIILNQILVLSGGAIHMRTYGCPELYIDSPTEA